MVIQCLATNVHGAAFSDGYINVLSELIQIGENFEQFKIETYMLH